MILVVGGFGAGKQAFVQQQWGYGANQIAHACLDERLVVRDVHLLLHEYAVDEVLEILAHKHIVIGDEVGCGVVPLDSGARQWRQEVGQLYVELARQAQVVVRVCCGIPQVIKGQL